MIHLAWRPSSSEPREVFALWGKGGDLGFSSVCEASHNTYLFLCIYIYRDMRICTCVSCMYILKKNIYLYYNMCFFGWSFGLSCRLFFRFPW